MQTQALTDGGPQAGDLDERLRQLRSHDRRLVCRRCSGHLTQQDGEHVLGERQSHGAGCQRLDEGMAQLRQPLPCRSKQLVHPGQNQQQGGVAVLLLIFFRLLLLLM